MEPTRPEDLLVHAASLRQLALGLVADEGRAEDVVQETWLVVLRGVPATLRSPFAWLATVARNVAAKMGREESRRRAREERWARPEKLPSADELSERARVQRELTDLLLELDDPYRTALLYRYFEDLPPRGIARKMRAPVATVNTWLLRGRERMRRRLGERYGESAMWCPMLLAWAQGIPKGAVALSAPTAVLSKELLLVSAAVVSVGLGVGIGFAVREGVRVETDGEREVRVANDMHRVETGLPAVTAPDPSPASRATDLEPTAPLRPEPEEEARPTRRWRALRTVSGPLEPPGLILIRGGPTSVGSKVEDAIEIMGGVPGIRGMVAAETPQHRVQVDDFFLMPTEVTNEQYAEFVRATRAEPPYYWGEEALDEGRLAFLGEQAALRKAAIEAGERPPKRELFDKQKWWEDNWRGAEWEVPEDVIDHPVTHVTYADVLAYCRWSGLRPMTEAEFQRACRGDTDRIWPWGNQWNPRNAATLEARRDDVWSVGSFPGGAVDGIFDLVGNVWEWTSTPYTAYVGNDSIRITTGKGARARQILAIGEFNADYRVAVGGSFANDELAARIATRRGSDQAQRSQALGFRCAADPAPAASTARLVVESNPLLSAEDYDVEAAFLVQGWSSRPGTVDVEGYAVIDGHWSVLIVPARAVSGLAEGIIGLLVTSHSLAMPEAPAGAYLVELTDEPSAPFALHPPRGTGVIPVRGGSVERGRFLAAPPEAASSLERDPRSLRFSFDAPHEGREVPARLELELTFASEVELDGEWHFCRAAD